MRKGFEKRRCPLCREEEDVLYNIQIFGNEELD
jgi:hypothetical protein